MARIESLRPQMEKMARDIYGVTIHSGKFGIDSRPALIGAKYAQVQGQGESYNTAVLRAYWQQAQDISDETVLRHIAESVGLNGDDFIQALHDPTYDLMVTQDVDAAHRLRINGVPALLFKEKYLVSGAQPYDALVDILKQIETLEQNESR